MLTRPLVLKGKFAVRIAGALFAFLGVLQLAAEPIQFSGEKETSDPEKKPAETQSPPHSASLSSKLFRPYRPLQSVPGLETFNPQPFLAAPRAPTAPLSKREGDLLDRQKNWIFLRPQDEKKTDAAEKAFGVKDNSLEPRKSVLTQFLENKSASETKEDSAEKTEQTKNLKALLFGPENEKTKRDGQSTSSLQPQFLEKDLKSQVTPDKPGLAALWNDQYGPRANRLREEKESQMKQFESFFSGNGAASSAPGFGMINGQNNFLAQPLTPANPALAPFNSSPSLSSLDAVKAAARSSSPDISALPNVNNRLFGASAFSTRAPEMAKPIAQPATLPFPKRRF